jgi:hypothetical protein
LSKYVNISVVTDNGAILEHPITMSFVCANLHPVGMVDFNVRNYTISDCIEVKRVFGLRYGHDLYGTNDFSTMAEWIAFRNTACVPCGQANQCCAITYNGCLITYKGQTILSQRLN